MPTDKTIPTRFKQGLGQGESDDFVLPLAPPPPPAGRDPIRNPGGNMSEPSSSIDAAGDGAPIEDKPSAVSCPPTEGLSPGTQDKALPQVTEPSGKSAPWPLVVILAFVIIGLLIAISNQSNENASNTLSAHLPTVDDGAELVSARNEVKSMRASAEQMSQKFKDSAQQLKNEKTKFDAQVETLRREKEAAENKVTALDAEVGRLRSQIQESARKDPVPDKPAQPIVPPAPKIGKLYRVAGLYSDDSLNLRSGPGASNPIVIQLKNGVELFVTGAPVTNGPDVWLPCVIENAGSSSLRGWVNANFVEAVASQ